MILVRFADVAGIAELGSTRILDECDDEDIDVVEIYQNCSQSMRTGMRINKYANCLRTGFRNKYCKKSRRDCRLSLVERS